MKKNNTATTKQHIISAINNLPKDNVLANAKSYLKKALIEVENVESKRVRRETTQSTIAQDWENKLKQTVANSTDPLNSLKVLEKLMEQEQAKLNKTKSVATDSKPTTLVD